MIFTKQLAVAQACSAWAEKNILHLSLIAGLLPDMAQ
ncbi:hypothetical protein BCF46_3898 [Litoreibacter meonggei]|uniref:Uncharacterized protein n=1 Tax=Litoreibacter meonggei TaxID=1049199 RepID=A0A497V670_9RHOB|nr:hypothetical protein BCF46_3898 [Litoreibacter meonggei]